MSQPQSDLQSITETVQRYFDGMYHRDVGLLRNAFHPQACLFGHLQGKFVHVSAEQWFEAVRSRPVPAESGEPYDMKIVSTDVTADVATVKVAELYRGLRFTDYLTLVKTDGAWLIVNKAFHHD